MTGPNRMAEDGGRTATLARERFSGTVLERRLERWSLPSSSAPSVPVAVASNRWQSEPGVGRMLPRTPELDWEHRLERHTQEKPRLSDWAATLNATRKSPFVSDQAAFHLAPWEVVPAEGTDSHRVMIGMIMAGVLAGVVIFAAVCRTGHFTVGAASAPHIPSLEQPLELNPYLPSAVMPVPVGPQADVAASVRQALLSAVAVPDSRGSNPSPSASVAADGLSAAVLGSADANSSFTGQSVLLVPSVPGWGQTGGLSVAPAGDAWRPAEQGQSASPYGTVAIPAGAVAIWPARGPISSVYGPTHPLGIDIAIPTGTPIRAMAAGKVTFSGGDPCCSYGYYVDIDHGNGVATRYGHFVVPSFLRPGQIVRIGDVLGFSGSTGFSTGPHLHFEVRYFGRPVNPLLVLP